MNVHEDNNFENVEIVNEEVVPTEIVLEDTTFESDYEIDSGEVDTESLESLKGGFDEYRNIKIKQETTFLDPATGEIVDRNSLPILEQIKQVAKSIGQEVNAPNKSCKKCHGRGYTGINLDGNIPVACDCIFKEWHKANPKKDQNFFPENRRARRNYEKMQNKYSNFLKTEMEKRLSVIDKSKKNLRKNTPKNPEVHVETAEGTI